MDKNTNDIDWKSAIEHVKDMTLTVAEKLDLVDEEKDILNEWMLSNERALERLKNKTDEQALTLLGCIVMSLIMVGWLELGFSPSQFKAWGAEINNSWDLTASLYSWRKMFKKTASNIPEMNGVSQFWASLMKIGWGDCVQAKELIDIALMDDSLPQGMRLTGLQIKNYCNVKLKEYDQSEKTLLELFNSVSTSQNKYYVGYMAGYISASHQDKIIPDDMPKPLVVGVYGEILLNKECEFSTGENVKAETMKISLPVEDLAIQLGPLIDKILKPTRMAILQAKEEIIGNMPNTRTLEEVRQDLRSEYGDWINKLANPGALINAEFLNEALTSRSWSEVIVGYANAVEAEIKVNLLPKLRNSLKREGVSLESMLERRSIKGGSDLGYTQKILEAISSNAVLKKLLSSWPKETADFLLYDLPYSLADLRGLRNPSTHGAIINRAKEIRKLVLGTPEKPGLLQNITEIKFP